MSLADAFKARRAELGLTYGDVAAVARCSVQFLCDVEHGRREVNSERLIDGLAEALDWSTDYLWYLAGRFPPNCVRENATEAQILRAYAAFRDVLCEPAP